PRGIRQDGGRKAPGIRPGSWRRVLRHAGNPQDRADGRREGVLVVLDHNGHCDERPVSNAESRMIITKKAMDRRTMLRGVGAAMALPLLDSMVLALTALGRTVARPVRRFGAVYVPNGIVMSNWTPQGEARG